jgi:hypothetical protein
MYHVKILRTDYPDSRRGDYMEKGDVLAFYENDEHVQSAWEPGGKLSKPTSWKNDYCPITHGTVPSQVHPATAADCERNNGCYSPGVILPVYPFPNPSDLFQHH